MKKNDNQKTLLQEYGEKVRSERKKSNLTQKQLAERVGISHEWICKIEKAKVNNLSVGLMQKIADSLNFNLTFSVADDVI